MLYKPKKSPFWHFDFQLHGIRFCGSTGTADRNAARQIEAAKRTEAAAGGTKRRPQMTLNAAAGRYFEEVASPQASAATTDYQLANLIAGLGKDRLLSELTSDEISAYVSRRRAHVSNASANRETQLLRRLMRRAATTWRVDVGEMPDWRPLLLPEADGRTRALSHAEEKRLVQHLPNDFRPLLRFCILTGMRLMNAARLTWAQINAEAGEIKILVKSRKHVGGRNHVVPISAAVGDLLAEQRGKHPTFVFTYTCRRSRGGRRKGERYPYLATTWRKEWKRALEAAGIEDFKFHDTRHTAGSRTARVAGLAVTKELLGHQDISSTMRYVHATRDDVREAMDAAESRNNPEPKPTTTRKSLKRGK